MQRPWWGRTWMRVMSYPEISDAVKAALASALRWLARREYSVLEIRKRLELSGYKSAITDTVIERLLREGWLSDQRFAENFCRGRSAQGYGPARIRHEMRLHGLPDELIDEALAEACCESDELVRQLYAKKYRGVPPLTPREQASRVRYLLRRGFSMSQIMPLVLPTHETNETLE